MAGDYGSSSISSSVSSTMSKDANVNRQAAGRATDKFKGESPGDLPIFDPFGFGGNQMNKISGSNARMINDRKPGFFTRLNATDTSVYDELY